MINRSKATERDNRIDRALARAVLYRTLKQGFSPPMPAGLLDQEGRRALVEAASVLEVATRPLTSMAKALNRLADVGPESCALQFARLFGHTARGAVCPYETEYGGDAPFLQSQILADIAGFYLAFGLEQDKRMGERLDHIAVELEFAEFLAKKEAFALETGDSNMLDETVASYRRFFRDHLSRFVPAVASQLVRQDPQGFYGALGRLCGACIAAECCRLEIPPGPEFLTLRPESLDDTPMACGAESDLIQLR